MPPASTPPPAAFGAPPRTARPRATRPVVVAYVSGHGYGHFVRSAAVLERVARVAEVHVRTSSRALELAAREPWVASLTEVDVGPGVAQLGPLAVDVAGTRAALAAHLSDWESVVARESAALVALGATLVFADVPPIAFAAADAARVPSVALANFSWSWIYEGYAHHDAWFARAAAHLRAAEALATELLALEMGGGLDAFPRHHPVAPVARPPTQSRAAARARLPFAAADPRPIVLLSFGGFGAELDVEAAAGANPGCRFLVVSAPVRHPSSDLQPIAPTDTLPHQDLILAVDAVVGKPGYGTVAECLARPTPFVHVPRGEFREYAGLVEAIERWLPSAHLGAEDFAAGRWSDALARAITAAPPAPAPRPDGVDAAARRVVALAAGD